MNGKSADYLVVALFLVPALIHLMPLSGVLGEAALARLYGLDFSGTDLQILMRHRAVLFGLLGGLLLAAAFRPSLRGVAVVLGLGSVLSFLALALGVGGYGAPVARVVAADVVALACLLGAGWMTWRKPGPASGQA